MNLGFACLVFQVGMDVRAIVETRTAGYDKDGNDVITSGSATMEVRGTDRSTKGIAESVVKAPNARHLKTAHQWAEVAKYDDNGTKGITVLCHATFKPSTPAVAETPAAPAAPAADTSKPKAK